MNRKLYLGMAVVVLTAAFGGTAIAANDRPGGLVQGTSSASSGALVTLAIPSVVGVNVGHNFVLDFDSAHTNAPCYGTGSGNGGAFPQAASGTTKYYFAVNSAARDHAANPVQCPSSGASAPDATVQVFSTGTTGTHLGAAIVDGGEGGGATTFLNLISTIWSGNRLKLETSGDSCGAGTVVGTVNVSTTAADLVTSIPATGWSDCRQKLSLTLDSSTAVSSGTATGTLTFTISHP